MFFQYNNNNIHATIMMVLNYSVVSQRSSASQKTRVSLNYEGRAKLGHGMALEKKGEQQKSSDHGASDESDRLMRIHIII